MRVEQWPCGHVEVVEIADLREIDLEHVFADKIAHAFVHAYALLMARRVKRNRSARHVVHEHVEIGSATLIESRHGEGSYLLGVPASCGRCTC